MSYRSPFKRVKIDEVGGKKIQRIQELFDTFWSQIHKYADKCPEKFHAQKAMQEACMWMTRATAIQNERKEGKESDHVLDAKSYLTAYQSPMQDSKSNSGASSLKNSPTIVIKKKKI